MIEVERNFDRAYIDRDEMRRAHLELEAIWDAVHAGFFVENSLFFKTLTRMLGPERTDNPVTRGIDRGKNPKDQSRTRIESLDAEAQYARTELMRLTYSVAAKQDFERWVERELKSGIERRDHLRTELTNRAQDKGFGGDCDLTAAGVKTIAAIRFEDCMRFLERVRGGAGRVC